MYLLHGRKAYSDKIFQSLYLNFSGFHGIISRQKKKIL